MLDLYRRSYRYSYYLHAAMVVFVVLPLAFSLGDRLNKDVLETINVSTISAEMYKKFGAQYTISDKVTLGKGKPRKIPLIKPLPKSNTPLVKNPPKKTEQKVKPTSPKKTSAPSKTALHDGLDKIINKTTTDLTVNDDNIEKAIVSQDQNDDEYASINPESGGTTLTIRELILLQVTSCWNEFHSDDKEAENLTVIAIVDYRGDGSVAGILIKDQLFPHATTRVVYNEMVNDAKTAIMNCSPLHGLNSSTYPQWRKMRFNLRHKKRT